MKKWKLLLLALLLAPVPIGCEIEADAEWVSLSGGETLFRRGDPGDAAYIVISGRLRVVDDAAGERALSEIGAGETLGEMALLSGEGRSATVFAVRDSLLAKLSAEAFNRLVERHPRVLRRIAGFLVERLRRRGESTPAERTGDAREPPDSRRAGPVGPALTCWYIWSG